MIYFIAQAHGNYIKIGYTATEDVHKRLQALQIGNPMDLRLVGVIPGDMDDEAELHERFGGSRVRGEWFEYTPEMGRYILEHTVGTPSVMDDEAFMKVYHAVMAKRSA